LASFAPIVFHGGKANQLHRRPIGELCHKVELSAHALDTTPQRRNQQIGALLELGNPLLADMERCVSILLEMRMDQLALNLTRPKI
jgi:hypothetical protein